MLDICSSHTVTTQHAAHLRNRLLPSKVTAVPLGNQLLVDPSTQASYMRSCGALISLLHEIAAYAHRRPTSLRAHHLHHTSNMPCAPSTITTPSLNSQQTTNWNTMAASSRKRHAKRTLCGRVLVDCRRAVASTARPPRGIFLFSPISPHHPAVLPLISKYVMCHHTKHCCCNFNGKKRIIRH